MWDFIGGLVGGAVCLAVGATAGVAIASWAGASAVVTGVAGAFGAAAGGGGAYAVYRMGHTAGQVDATTKSMDANKKDTARDIENSEANEIYDPKTKTWRKKNDNDNYNYQ